MTILRSFSQRSPFPVRIFSNVSRLGYSDNFLRAASLCKGDWIAFCDQDDVWLRCKLGVVKSRIVRIPDLALVSHSAFLVTAELTPSGRYVPYFQRDRVAELLQLPLLDVFVGFSTIFNRHLLEFPFSPEIRPVNPRDPSQKISHDQWIYLVATAVGRTALISQPLVYYRRHPEALTGLRQASLSQAVLAARATGRREYLHDSRWANECATALLHLAESTVGVETVRLRTASEAYKHLAQALAIRSEIYGMRYPQKLQAFATLLFLGAYVFPRNARFRLAGIDQGRRCRYFSRCFCNSQAHSLNRKAPELAFGREP